MIRNLIKKEIEKAVKKLFREKVDFVVSIDGRFGDYSSNVAIILKGDPKENAEKIKSELNKSKFFSTSIAGPGFLNFTLSEKGLVAGLTYICDSKYKLILGKGRKVQVEFISANPTGELHIGHGRSAFYGDALANVLTAVGYKVEREYFVNDSRESTQIKELGKTALGKGISYLTENLKKKIQELRIKNQDESEVGYLVAKKIQKDNEKFIKKIGIKFDKWFSEEKELHAKKVFEKVLEMLKKKKLAYEKDRAIWLKTSQFGDEEDRVIVRSDGAVSYFLSDIAYHINKFGRKYDKVIDIWGADHHGHVKRMMIAKEMLKLKGDLEILISQLVTLKKGEELQKLSKRKGNVILLKDLVEDLGLDAVRWFYLQKTLSTHMEFDLDLAKEQSAKNPVYYVQYAGARMSSILAKSEIRSTKFETISKSEILKIKLVRNLVLKLIQFSEVVEDTAKDYQVHRLTTYAYELASEFSQFYRDVKVIGSENEKELIALVALTRNILAKTLKLLGISAPEKM
ncbi:MAG: arginine--tRNA ligase [Candidatus Terrybacteria bacterium]|nr:arginine--tRNA ligase [Candidatus Terrybacteria bacterium]